MLHEIGVLANVQFSAFGEKIYVVSKWRRLNAEKATDVVLSSIFVWVVIHSMEIFRRLAPVFFLLGRVETEQNYV